MSMNLHLDATLASPADRLCYTRLLLRAESPTAPAPASHPLSVLLFLLDGLAFLRLAADAQAHSSRSDSLGVGLGINEGDDADTEDSGPFRRKASNATSTGSSSSRAGRSGGAGSSYVKHDDDVPSWDEWRDYIEEVYGHPLTPSTASSTTWTSPFYISKSIMPSLASLCLDPTPGVLRTCLLSCIFHLSTATPASALLIMLREPIDFPELLPAPMLHSITSMLSSLRRKNSVRRTATYRSILETLLEHHFPANFGPSATASHLDDRDAILKFWAEEPTSDNQETASDEEDVATSRNSVTAARVATLNNLRKDEKLRWIFGDNFSSSPSPPTIPSRSPVEILSFDIPRTSSSHSPPLQQRPARPLSMSSLESATYSMSSYNSSFASHSHRRLHSTSSSTAPLLVHSYAQPFLPLGPPSPSVPFGNLEATPSFSNPFHSPTKNSTKGFDSSPSSSCSSLPATTNALSVEAKRDLVRRSRKLKHIFGVPLEEAAAGEVLVKARRMSVPPSSPRTKSATSAGRGTHHHHVTQSVSMSRGHSSPLLRQESREMERSFSAPGSVFGSHLYEPGRERDERRKRVDKLQRLLGERVPAEMVSTWSPPTARSPASTSSTMTASPSMGPQRTSSKGLGGLFRTKSKSTTGKKRTSPMMEQHLVLPPFSERRDSAERSMVEDLDPVRAMSQARKMEQMFGTLPPRSFYALHAPSGSRSSFQSFDSSTGPPRSRQPSISESAHEYDQDATPVSPRSFESYRTSIASLHYIAQTNPAALDELAEQYHHTRSEPSRKQSPSPSTSSTGESGRASAAGPLDLTDSERELRMRKNKLDVRKGESDDSAVAVDTSAEEASLEVELSGSRRGSSGREDDDEAGAVPFEAVVMNGQRRTVRKAMKLANILGTTRGEVWNSLLNDLQIAAEQDPDLDEEERAEVLSGVARLRGSEPR